MNIIVYTKTGCPWGKEVIDFLQRIIFLLKKEI
jgi:glutaredoxin